MLNPFPTLLWLSLATPFLLRVVVGIFFLLFAIRHFKDRTLLTEEFSNIFKSFSGGAVWLLFASETALGALLIMGLYTQIAALLGGTLCLKFLWFKKRYPALSFQTRSFYVLLFAVLFSLLITGAGILAFDLPL